MRAKRRPRSVRSMKKALLVCSILVCAAGTAHADDPYNLPWQLRGAAAANVVRSDSSVASYDDGTTMVSTLLASYKVTPSVAPLVRIAFTNDDVADATAVSNPLFGVVWAKPLAPAFKGALFGAFTLPVGSGGGNSPDMPGLLANRAGIAARSGMDNAMFAVNDLTLIVGGDVAYVKSGVTLQAEMTVLQLNRVRGGDVQPDAHKTNFTAGLHAGYFATPWLSLGGELRYQRYLSTPAAVTADAALRDTTTVAAGVRFHVKLPEKRWLRPGVSYSRPLDDPMTGKGYDVIQLDVPFIF
jgi:hypothetical protein